MGLQSRARQFAARTLHPIRLASARFALVDEANLHLRRELTQERIARERLAQRYDIVLQEYWRRGEAIDALMSTAVQELRDDVSAMRRQRNADLSAPWVLPRVTMSGALTDATGVTIPGPTMWPMDPPSGCVQVSTDEGGMWAVARDRVIMPNLRDLHTWEPELTEVLARHVTPGMAAVDVGANIGYTTRVLARLVGPSGIVVAFEPEPLNFSVLCTNVAELGPERIRCVQAAAAQRNGVATLWLDEENLGDHRTWGRPPRGEGRSVRVPVVRVDDIIDDGLPVGVVKVDTQGTDHLVMRGMEGLLSRCRPVVVVEFWPGGIEGAEGDPAEVLNYYHSLGFTISVIDPKRGAPDVSDSVGAVLDYTLSTDDKYLDLLLTPR